MQVKTNEDLLATVQSKEGIEHLKLGCPLLRINAKDAAKHAQVLFDLIAVEPNDAIKERLEEELQRIPDRAKGFNALHLRIEDDWMRHCRTWCVLLPAAQPGSLPIPPPPPPPPPSSLQCTLRGITICLLCLFMTRRMARVVKECW